MIRGGRIGRHVMRAGLGAALIVAAAWSSALGITVSVTPTNLVILAGQSGDLTLTNPDQAAATYDLRIGNYEIRPDGSVRIDPKEPPSRSARDWLKVSPTTVQLAAGASTTLHITSRRVSTAAPGDHHALVLISSRPEATPSGVAVRARVGIGVIVRVPGDIIRKVIAARPYVVTSAGSRSVRVKLTNRGNVNERFLTGQIRMQVLQGHRVIARLRARPQSILPGTSGVISLPYRGRVHGLLRVVVSIRLARPAVAGPGIASTPAPIFRSTTLVL